MNKEALNKINKEEVDIGDNGDELRLCLSVWINCDPQAPALVLDTSKTLKGCIAHMTAHARKKQKGGCYHPSREEALDWILEYYGVEKDRRQEIIENGLMYSILQEESSRWQPFDKATVSPAEPPKPQTPAPQSDDLFAGLGLMDDL